MILEVLKDELDSIFGNRVFLNIAPTGVTEYPYAVLDVSQKSLLTMGTTKKKSNLITIQVFSNESSATELVGIIVQVESALNEKVLSETGTVYTALIPVSSETPKRTLIRNWRAQLTYKNLQS